MTPVFQIIQIDVELTIKIKLQLKKLPIKYIFHTQTDDVELKKKKNPVSGHAEAIQIRTIETLTSLGLHHLVF